MVAAAVVGAAAIGAVGSAKAGHDASKATEKGAKGALAEQVKAREASERMSAPYRALGEKAIGSYEDLLGLGAKGQAGIAETLSNLPGYQFAKSQGIEGTSRAAAAQGLNLSGNQVAGVTEYATNLADQTYGEQLNRLLAPIQTGQSAAAGQSAMGQNAANNSSGIIQNQADNIAGIRANTTAGITGAVTNGVNQYTTQHTLDGLMHPGGAGGLPPPVINNAVPTYGS